MLKFLLPTTFAAATFFSIYGCGDQVEKRTTDQAVERKDSVLVTYYDSSTILLSDTGNLPEVPILCYHQIREIKSGDGPNSKAYTVTPSAFASHMKMLHDSGYHTILPDDLYQYLFRRKRLPLKPVMITFDDGSAGQYTAALPEMNKYGFKGVFFIMTISINRKNYMSAEQLQHLHFTGHAVESHTFDHKTVVKYQQQDWETELGDAERKLESVIGKKPKYFAYPYGLWNGTAVDTLRARGYKLAFILNSKKDEKSPLFTVRRVTIGYGNTAKTVLNHMQKQFM